MSNIWHVETRSKVRRWHWRSHSRNDGAITTITALLSRRRCGEPDEEQECILLLLTLTVALMALIACSDSGTKPAASGQPGVEEAVGTAVDAYIYGYPLVTMDMTRRQFTNVATPDAAHAPMGQS